MSQDTLIKTNDGAEFMLSEVDKIVCKKTECEIVFKNASKSSCVLGLEEAHYYNQRYNVRIDLSL